jgi:hypothetical protein
MNIDKKDTEKVASNMNLMLKKSYPYLIRIISPPFFQL